MVSNYINNTKLVLASVTALLLNCIVIIYSANTDISLKIPLSSDGLKISYELLVKENESVEVVSRSV